MKKNRKSFDGVSRFALTVLVALIIFAIFANSLIMVSDKLGGYSYFAKGTFRLLFDYSDNIQGKHWAMLLGQAISNSIAYFFMLAAIVIFILSLCLIKHDKSVKAKCAILGLALFIPATIGLAGGAIDFFAHGFGWLNSNKGLESALIMGSFVTTFVLDIAFLVLTVITLVEGIGTAVKVNRGEVIYEAKPKEAPKAVSAEEIRKIVAEELNKLDRIVIAKEVKEAPKKEAKKPEPAPAPVVEEEDESKKLSIQRIPFAEKIVKADKELQEKYNEIKSELLAYGASSRVSIACDTFRLHRKPYVKITLVGKTLKVYFALDPKEFVDSPIPVIDSSDKVAYEEVPALLKVKSNLSVKRAKELAEMAFSRDGVQKEKEAEAHNWVKEIRAELRAKK